MSSDTDVAVVESRRLQTYIDPPNIKNVPRMRIVLRPTSLLSVIYFWHTQPFKFDLTAATPAV